MGGVGGGHGGVAEEDTPLLEAPLTGEGFFFFACLYQLVPVFSWCFSGVLLSFGLIALCPLTPPRLHASPLTTGNNPL